MKPIAFITQSRHKLKSASFQIPTKSALARTKAYFGLTS